MAKLDVRTLTQAADELLETLENPLHRQIIENYRRHALLEVTGQWELIFAPEMTVEHPVYYLNVDGGSVTLDGYEQVTGFYQQLTESGATVIVLQDEQLAVADWGLASEAVFNTYVDGSALPDGEQGEFYIVRRRVAMHWPYDRRVRLIGEHVYEHAAHTETVKIPESGFITLDEAKEKLIPLIRRSRRSNRQRAASDVSPPDVPRGDETVDAGTFTLPAGGTHTVRIEFLNGSLSLDRIPSRTRA